MPPRGNARMRRTRSFSDLFTCSTGFDIILSHIFEDRGAWCAHRQSTPLSSGTSSLDRHAAAAQSSIPEPTPPPPNEAPARAALVASLLAAPAGTVGGGAGGASPPSRRRVRGRD
eukprot:8240926-Pyramimonas_sp.AAC.1